MIMEVYPVTVLLRVVIAGKGYKYLSCTVAGSEDDRNMSMSLTD